MTAMQGSVAVITGAARGIGRAIAERFSEEGARVALLDLDSAAAEILAASLGGAAIGLGVDVGDEASVEVAVGRTVEAFGEIDVLVNNAAAPNRRESIAEMAPADWDLAVRVNLTGVFLMSRAVLRSMKRAGGGAIINVASQLGSVAMPEAAVYCATKGAVLQLTRAMALDHAGDGVRVNSLSPGAVMTDRLIALFGSEEEARKALSPKHPIGRIGEPEDVAGAAVFLASKDAAFMTGADLIVDGGYTAQ